MQTVEQFLRPFRIRVVLLPLAEVRDVVFANFLGQIYSFVCVEGLSRFYVREWHNAYRE
jgi:hypothetical protein